MSFTSVETVMQYSAEIIIGMAFIIACLCLLVAGLSSQLNLQKQAAKRLCRRLDDTLRHSEQAVKDHYHQ